MTKRAHIEHRQVATLDLGRTHQERIHISSDSGETFLAEVYRSVNLQENPELREPLLQGALTQIPDPADTKRTYTLAIPLVCHDPERKIFALFIPEALRHQEFALRQDLLQELAKSDRPLPEYMRRFQVSFDLEELLTAEEERAVAEDATIITENAAPSQEIDALEARVRELEEQAQAYEQQLEEAARGAEAEVQIEVALRDREAELQAQEEALQIEGQQLQEVASRIERESARIDETRQALQQEQLSLARLREELEGERRRLQVMELNLEQAKLRMEQSAPMMGDYADEKTQVVTDDQFIEIVEHHDGELQAVEGEIQTALPPRFPALTQSKGPYFTTVIDDQPVVGFALPADRAQIFQEVSLDFVFQLHTIDEIPLISLTLLAFDGDGNLADTLAAPIIDWTPEENEFLNILAAERQAEVGIYGDDGQRSFVWTAEVNGIGNLGWARHRTRQWQEEAGQAGASAAEEAAARLAKGETELWGSMRHPFHPESFTELSSASEVQLAVGILEYWSLPEQIDYLVGNRAFPVQLFIEIQKRVIRQALHWGIVPGVELQELAITEAIIPDLMSLTQRLLANFAELCVGIRPNDLDPLEQWENWEALIHLAERNAVQPDPDVLELAEISLKRAQEFEEMLENEHEEVVEILSGDALVETFDDMESLEREDLLKMLNDQDGRLEAAKILVARHGEEVLEEVLLAAEEMNTAQLKTLGETFEVHASALEKRLAKLLKESGSAGTYLAARTLSARKNMEAIPDLLKAAQAQTSKNDQAQMADALARYGELLLEPLSKALRQSPQNTGLLRVLIALEESRRGTFEELKKDRNKNLRRAVDQAQELVKGAK